MARARNSVWHDEPVIPTTTVPEPAPFAALVDAVTEECGWSGAEQVSAAEDILDALVGMTVLVLPDRWDEECHRCERRTGDHTIDGRCPA